MAKLTEISSDELYMWAMLYTVAGHITFVDRRHCPCRLCAPWREEMQRDIASGEYEWDEHDDAQVEMVRDIVAERDGAAR